MYVAPLNRSSTGFMAHPLQRGQREASQREVPQIPAHSDARVYESVFPPRRSPACRFRGLCPSAAPRNSHLRASMRSVHFSEVFPRPGTDPVGFHAPTLPPEVFAGLRVSRPIQLVSELSVAGVPALSEPPSDPHRRHHHAAECVCSPIYLRSPKLLPLTQGSPLLERTLASDSWDDWCYAHCGVRGWIGLLTHPFLKPPKAGRLIFDIGSARTPVLPCKRIPHPPRLDQAARLVLFTMR